ncbi:MAG: efflux RND transporter periplasmic adaptor subunit [Rhizobacter sp.]|nr:efflux RND transporter periplasmic adaptor subunit [Chlorobiales bacterium]
MADAKKTLARNRALHTAGTLSDADLQKSETVMQTAKANAAAAAAQFANTFVNAPFGGRIIKKLIDVGGTPATGICTIVDDSETIIEVDVNQNDVAKLKPDQPALVTLDAYPLMEYAAVVKTIMPAADKTKNTVQVKVRITKPDDTFKYQMSGKVFFVTEPQTENRKIKAQLVVSKSAVFEDNGQKAVWRIEDGKVFRRPVKTGEDLGDRLELVSGLAADDQVILNPQAAQFKDGMPVAVK